MFILLPTGGGQEGCAIRVSYSRDATGCPLPCKTKITQCGYSETQRRCIHVKILVLRIPVKVRMNESHFHYDEEGRDISCVITREQQGLIIPVVQVTKTESDGEKI